MTPADTTARNILTLHGHTARAWGPEGEQTPLDLSDHCFHCHTSLQGAEPQKTREDGQASCLSRAHAACSHLSERTGSTDVQTRLSESEGNFSIIGNTFNRQVGGWPGRLGLTYILYWYSASSPQRVRTYCTAQGTLLSALWWSYWVGNLRNGDICVYIYIWLVHFAEQQKLTQQCKATILQ